jgi:hypothetical protein
MLNKDSFLLEKAYLSVSQPVLSVPSDEEVTPEVQTSNIFAGETEPEVGCGCEDECACNSKSELSVEDELEEDTMSVDNLNSVRESTMKIAQYWEQGGHLEPWQQQKLAIVMAYLSDIARSLH